MTQGRRTRSDPLVGIPSRERDNRLAVPADGGSWVGRADIESLLGGDVRWGRVIRLRTAIQSGTYRVTSAVLADCLAQTVFAEVV